MGDLAGLRGSGQTSGSPAKACLVVVRAQASVCPGCESIPPDRSEIYSADLGTRSRPRCSRHSVSDLRGVSRRSTTEVLCLVVVHAPVSVRPFRTLHTTKHFRPG